MAVDSQYEGRLILGGKLNDQPIKDDWLPMQVKGLRLYRRLQLFRESSEVGSAPQQLHTGSWVDQTALEDPAAE
ncbi:MAG: hypothetical protein R3C11_07180 [Planctomycetaceae bacterium]